MYDSIRDFKFVRDRQTGQLHYVIRPHNSSLYYCKELGEERWSRVANELGLEEHFEEAGLKDYKHEN